LSVARRIGKIGVLRGASYPLWGLRFIYREQRGLARYWIWPIVLTVAMVAAVLGLVFARHDAIFELLWATPSGEGGLSWLASAAHAVLDVLFGIVLAGVGLVVAVLLGGVVAAPFNDALSEEVEHLLTGKDTPPFSLAAVLSDVARTVRLEAVKLIGYAVVMVPLFLASFLVPVVGHAAYSVFALSFTALYFALDYVDWPASRRGRGVRDRLSFARENFGSMFGFGLGVWLFLLVPVVNLFFMPAAVAGGTKLFLDLEGETTRG
jgi:CysZ protein